MTISLKDMIAELRRELRYRQIIYPSLINVLVSLEENDAGPEDRFHEHAGAAFL